MTGRATTEGANRIAVVALVVGIASLPAALTLVLGIVLGFVAIVTGFFGVARSHKLDGAGEGVAVAGIITGGFGMALGAAFGLFLK